MLLSLVDALRCPAHAEAAPLVMSVETWSGARVAEGVLGCPMCHARYPIHGGTVDFTQGQRSVRQSPSPSDRERMRLAAQLGLSEPGGILLLTGRHAHAHDVLSSVTDVSCILVDGPETTSATAVNFVLPDRLPLNDGVLRGAAVDEPRNIGPFLADAVRCLRRNGRIVAPTLSALPSGVRLIARDDREWVGELEDFTDPVRLRRAARP
jgi:hypothetical protein